MSRVSCNFTFYSTEGSSSTVNNAINISRNDNQLNNQMLRSDMREAKRRNKKQQHHSDNCQLLNSP